MLEEELVLTQAVQHEMFRLTMLLQEFGVDEDVIQVDTNNTFHDEVMEDVIHHLWKVAGELVRPKNIPGA
mgnify:CR=1 FL=1